MELTPLQKTNILIERFYNFGIVQMLPRIAAPKNTADKYMLQMLGKILKQPVVVTPSNSKDDKVRREIANYL